MKTNGLICEPSLEILVRKRMISDGGAHDWQHTQRVRFLANVIAVEEGADTLLTDACALLHDVSDPKLNGGNETDAVLIASEILPDHNFDPKQVKAITGFLSSNGFKNEDKSLRSGWPIEWKAVQDADYLDAIGAVGIARAFWFGGFRGEAILTTEVMPNLEVLEQGKLHQMSTISHFSEKLLKLSKLMLTPTGSRMSIKRHKFMLSFLAEFETEWNSQSSI